MVFEMELNLTDRGRWILASVLCTIAAIVFAVGWTSPFWPEWYPILGSDFIKTTFFFISSGIFIVLLVFSLVILIRTTPPPIKPIHSPAAD